MGEKELIFQLKKGSEKAFDKVYRLYAARLYGYCMQYTKSREDSEEIVQDVFIKLWQNKEKIIQTDTLRSLIFKIAKFQLINKYRSSLNSFSYEVYVDFYNEKKLSIDNAHHAIEYDDFCHILKKALKTLPETQQKVIEYCKLKNYSNKEAADKLQLKDQTVKNQLSIGLKTLKEILEKYSIWAIILLIVKKMIAIGTNI